MQFIKVQDLVEVLPGCAFEPLVRLKGLVVQVLSSEIAVVKFPQSINYKSGELSESFYGNDWAISFNNLRVLDSPHDSRLGEMEHRIQELEDNLVFSRSCLSMSEELRDQQVDLIERLVEELDMLKAKVYHLPGGNN